MNAMKMTLLSMTAAVAMMASVHAGASEELPYAEMKSACQKFLSAFATAKDLKSMESKLRTQVETKMSDQGMDEDRAMREIMLDWATSASKRLESKERTAITQACFFFIKFIDRGYQIPGQIRERLTMEKARKLIEYLDSETNKVKELASK